MISNKIIAKEFLMELVYLWVEDYKNIHKQGFNFSPNFDVKFTPVYENEKLSEKSELKITPKENPLKDFFGRNVNVTAIVGENGSGKSSIQKLLFLLIFLKKYQNIDVSVPENSSKESSIINIFKDKKLKDKNVFLIIDTEDGLRKISLLASIFKYEQPELIKFRISTINCCLKGKEDEYPELEDNKLNFFSIHFNYMIDTWYDDFYDLWTNNIYHRVDGYDVSLLLEPFKGDENGNYIDISNIDYLNNGKIFDFYAELKDNKHINSFFNPDSLWMMIDAEKIENKYYGFYDFDKNVGFYDKFQEFIYKKVRDKDLIFLNKLYLIIKIINSKKEIFKDKQIVEKLSRQFEDINNIEELEKKVNAFVIDDLLLRMNLPETQKLEICIDFHKEFTKENNQLKEYKLLLVLDPSNDDNFNKIERVFNIFDKIVPWIQVEFYDENKSYSSLSGGEKMFLNFAINLMYQIKNIKKLENQPYKTINLFLDEVEFGLHPDWQKRFLSELIDIIKFFDIKANLVYATHSPFIISDLPKENIIFLEKGKQVYPFDDGKQTFGANIHTLLSHGFFMKDGLMGEFAKSKIDDVINYLNNQKSEIKNDEDAQNIINIVGEPIIKRELQRMLKNKMELSNKTEIDTIKNEIKLLTERLEKLEPKEDK